MSGEARRPLWSVPPEAVPAYPAPTLPAQSSAQMQAPAYLYPNPYPYPIPYGYGVLPYFGGVPMVYPFLAEPARDTLKGLSRLRMATFVALGACGIQAIVGGFAVFLFLNPGIATGVLSLPPALGLQLVAFLLQLVAVAIGWSAFEELTDVAREINGDHASSARRAVHFMYFATATWCIGGLAGLAVFGAYFSSGLGTLPFGSLPPVALLSISASFAITGFAVNTLLAVAMQSLVAKLMRERGRKLRKSFYMFGIGGTAAAVGVSLVCRAILNAPDLAPLLSVAGAVSLAVYLVQIREAEEGARVLGVTRGTDPDAPMPSPPEAALQPA